MNLHTRSLLLLAIAVAQTYGAIYDKVSQLPTHAYDYIIIGGALPTQYPELKGHSFAIIVRRYCWQCARKPLDREQRHPSSRPRGWRKASRMSVIHHARRSSDCSNEGVVEGIVPFLCHTMSRGVRWSATDMFLSLISETAVRLEVYHHPATRFERTQHPLLPGEDPGWIQFNE